MSRPLSWYPLAPADPVPGDPVAVQRASERYADVAEAIRTAAGRLDEIADLGRTTSEAVSAVREKATEVAESVRKAHQRYQTVSAALHTYASALSGAQAGSSAALVAAQSAQHAIDSAQASVRTSRVALDDAEPDDVATRTRQLAHARDQLHDADARLARARADLDDAVVARDAAAQRAADTIRATTDSDKLNDGAWENWGSKVAHFMSDLAGAVAAVAGILALVLCWVPVLGQALAAVALIATAVKLIADIALLAHGEGSWADVAWDVVGIASFGAGRVLGTLAQATTRGAQGTARLAAGQALARAPRFRPPGVPVTSNGAHAMSQVVGTQSAALSRAAARGLASEGQIAPTLAASAKSALNPIGLGKDVAAGSRYAWSYLTDDVARAAAKADIAATFRGAGTNPQALFAATQADAALARAITANAQIAPEFAAASAATSHALSVASGFQLASAGSVAYGAFDVTLGTQATVESWGDANYTAPIAESYQWVSSFWGPTPSERLHLPQ